MSSFRDNADRTPTSAIWERVGGGGWTCHNEQADVRHTHKHIRAEIDTHRFLPVQAVPTDHSWAGWVTVVRTPLAECECEGESVRVMRVEVRANRRACLNIWSTVLWALCERCTSSCSRKHNNFWKRENKNSRSWPCSSAHLCYLCVPLKYWWVSSVFMPLNCGTPENKIKI